MRTRLCRIRVGRFAATPSASARARACSGGLEKRGRAQLRLGQRRRSRRSARLAASSVVDALPVAHGIRRCDGQSWEAPALRSRRARCGW